MASSIDGGVRKFLCLDYRDSGYVSEPCETQCQECREREQNAGGSGASPGVGGGLIDNGALLLCVTALTGCHGATGNVTASDPTERGLSYVACAIVTAAIIRAFFNK